MPDECDRRPLRELISLINVGGVDMHPEAADGSGCSPCIDARLFDFSYGDAKASVLIIDAQSASRWATTRFP
jgi:hypothetical protein